MQTVLTIDNCVGFESFEIFIEDKNSQSFQSTKLTYLKAYPQLLQQAMFVLLIRRITQALMFIFGFRVFSDQF